MGSPTANGNGLVSDLARLAGCELQVRGTLAGMVLCVDLDSSGDIENGYAFRLGIDETYDGVWISPATGNTYFMKGFRVKDPKGNSRAVEGAAPRKVEPMGRAARLASGDELAGIAEIANRLRALQ